MGRLERRVLGVFVAVIVLSVIFAVGLVSYLQKKSIYETATERMTVTAEVVSRTIEAAMLEGEAGAVRAVVDALGTIEGLGEVVVADSEGLSTFDGSGAVVEREVLERLRSRASPYVRISGGVMTVYSPLQNRAACRRCHDQGGDYLGVVKVSMNLDREEGRMGGLITFDVGASLFAVLALSLIVSMLLRRMVIRPVEKMESAARRVAEGDLTFSADFRSDDEIGQTFTALQRAFQSLSRVLQRVRDVTKRISRVSSEVEADSREVVEGTKREAEAVEDISSSIEQLSTAVTEVAESTADLARSSERSASSVERMAVRISQIAQNSNDLLGAFDSTSSSIEELSSSVKEVARSTDELSRAADDTLSAVEEITASIREVEGNTRESARLTERVVQEASSYGMGSIEKTLSGMERIKDSVQKTAEYIERLGGRSEEIGKILTVIDEVTDQTTLLALNAAILAAQAGEHGRGFSVVADEIKDLAERTSFSTQEIATLIQTVQQEVRDAASAMKRGLEAVNEGMGLASEAADALRKIVESARASSEMSSAIENATSEQAASARFVKESMEKVRDMSSQIARATSEQSRGMALIMEATEKVRNIAMEVKTATAELSTQSEQIRKNTEVVSDKSQLISSAINEQKSGAEQIKRSVRAITDLPVKNRNLAFKVNNAIRALVKDAELVVAEMEGFRLHASAADERVLRLGVVPLQSPAEMHRRFGPFVDYLGRKLGRHVELKVGLDFRSAIEDIGKGVTQFCYMTPSTFIIANNDYGVRVLVQAVRDGRPFHHSVIIARADSPISGIEDIRGRSFAFGDPGSTSSHIVPRHMLLEAGITLDDLLYYNYLGHHDDVAKAVLSGQYDAGAVMESAAERFREEGLKFVKISEAIPEFNVCVSKDLPDEDVEALRAALLSLKDTDPEGAAVLRAIDEHYRGFVDASYEDYLWIKEIMSRLGML